MNQMLEVHCIELDLEIFNKPRLVLKRKDGSVVKIFNLKKGQEYEAMKKITDKWLEAIKQNQGGINGNRS